MKIVMMIVEFQLPGCASLKEKRSRLSRIKEKFGRQPNLAVCESDAHDHLQRAQWTFVALSASGVIVDKILNNVEEHLEDGLDAVVAYTHREHL